LGLVRPCSTEYHTATAALSTAKPQHANAADEPEQSTRNDTTATPAAAGLWVSSDGPTIGQPSDANDATGRQHGEASWGD